MEWVKSMQYVVRSICWSRPVLGAVIQWLNILTPTQFTKPVSNRRGMHLVYAGTRGCRCQRGFETSDSHQSVCMTTCVIVLLTVINAVHELCTGTAQSNSYKGDVEWLDSALSWLCARLLLLLSRRIVVVLGLVSSDSHCFLQLSSACTVCWIAYCAGSWTLLRLLRVASYAGCTSREHLGWGHEAP